jgi:transmembrane sensor
MNKEKALNLIQKYRNRQITENELAELRQWMLENEDSVLIKEAIEEDMSVVAQTETIDAELLEKMFGNVISVDNVRKKAPVRRIPGRWLAAASIILVLAMASYFVLFNKGDRSDNRRTGLSRTKDLPAPKETRAMITLADGTRLYLDSAENGQIAVQGNTKLVKLSDGRIDYQSGSGGLTKEPGYNTLSNPRGSKVIYMKLSDGSQVWLNSGSSMTYPVAFIGSDRKVAIDGEAYFEITHDATKPFIVSKGETSVKVLGTHFNVNAYSDETELKVTLLEGSVEVKRENSKVRISPGEQAKVSSTINVERNVDTDEIMAWKNGMFLFDNSDLGQIMRQISRWYDVDVVYEKAIPNRKFGGGVSKNLPLSNVLELLKSNGIQAELDGKILKVK